MQLCSLGEIELVESNTTEILQFLCQSKDKHDEWKPKEGKIAACRVEKVNAMRGESPSVAEVVGC